MTTEATQMRPGRPVLRYFTEAELKPLSKQEVTAKPISLMRDTEAQDLRRFADVFGHDGEAVVALSELRERPHLGLFIGFCRALGAVDVRLVDDAVRVRPSGRLGTHVPEILFIYLEKSFTIIDNWNSIHLIPEDRVSALEFLHQMELRRIEQERKAGQTPRSLAERPVAFAIFRAENKKGESCYLFEINKDWRRLNFVGGKQEPGDGGDFLETVKREISEELGIGRNRLTLTRLNEEPIAGHSLSGNVGSLARYPCVLFGVRVDGELRTRIQDRWLTESTLRRCMEVDDCPIMVNPEYLAYLFGGTPSRLSQVPFSTPARVHATPIQDLVPNGEAISSRWIRVVRENKDLMAAVLTLAAALITVALTL